jgi:hypothetical protein
MKASTKLLLAGLGAGLLAVVLGALGGVLFGEQEGGVADALHFSQMFVLLAAVLLLAGGAVSWLARKVGTDRRSKA